MTHENKLPQSHICIEPDSIMYSTPAADAIPPLITLGTRVVGRVSSTLADGTFGFFVIEAATASKATIVVLRAASAHTLLRNRNRRVASS